MDVNEFAQLVLAQQKAHIAARYSQWQADAEITQVIPGPVYTKVNFGPEHNVSGKFMVENATGIIYGIKGYGKVHKGHMYGTLATVDQWHWGGYGPVRKSGVGHSATGICTLAPDRPRADVGMCRACIEQGLFDAFLAAQRRAAEG